MTRMAIFIALGVIVLVALVLIARRSGPQVTTIETRRHDEAADTDRDEP